MNISKAVFDSEISTEEKVIDRTPWLRQREEELIKIIETVSRVKDSEDWKILSKYIFEGVVEVLERKLKEETSKSELNQSEIHRLNGQLVWARKYTDLNKVCEVYKLELTNTRNQLKKISS